MGEAIYRGWADAIEPFAEARPEQTAPEPEWSTAHTTILDLPYAKLHDFSDRAGHGLPTLIVTPFALHQATVADFAPGHSLVEELRSQSSAPLLLLEWKSATAQMQFLSIDDYLAMLNVAVDVIGGPVNLVGLCQGGWMSLVYAARFPDKVGSLVLVGSPVDLGAGRSHLVEAARWLPSVALEDIIRSGGGLAMGKQMLALWHAMNSGREATAAILERDVGALEADLYERFRRWNAATVDLPGTYYLQVVEWLFRENRLATGRFVALGRRLDLGEVRVPLFLLAGRGDVVTPAYQLLATADLVGTPPSLIETAVAPCGHLSLFMGCRTLAHEWRRIARWLTDSERFHPAAKRPQRSSGRQDRARNPAHRAAAGLSIGART
jgi:poly(3-hydroxyalkanoate) synthetase